MTPRRMRQLPPGKFDGVPTEPLDLGEAAVTPRPIPARTRAPHGSKGHCSHCGARVETVATASGRLYTEHYLSDALGRRICTRSGTVAPEWR